MVFKREVFEDFKGGRYMIDFTNAQKRNKGYGGANGNKISIMYEDELYMLKFPPSSKKNKELSYTNGCISEYIGCHIFNSLGITAQETKLGTYTTANGKEKIVVACKDFTKPGIVIQDFASIKNQIINSEHSGYGTELSDILETIKEQTIMNPKQLEEFFWDMFIVDAFIGNWDRHNGNWGFLYNTETDEINIAPIFDCGSCLYPPADDKLMKKILSEKEEFDFRIFNIPTSAIKINDIKINYFDYLSSLSNKSCNLALKRIAKRIDLEKINKIIYDIPCINSLHKEFYSTMLKERKERIIDFSLKKLKNKEKALRDNEYYR